MRVGNVDYISLTDLAKFKDSERYDYIIQNWLRSKHTLEYVGTWEVLYNPNFNSIEFDGFKNEAGTHSFVVNMEKYNSVLLTTAMIIELALEDQNKVIMFLVNSI